MKPREVRRTLRVKKFIYYKDLKAKILYLINTIPYKSFDTCKEVAKYFDCSTGPIITYLDNNKFYKNQWILTSFPKKCEL